MLSTNRAYHTREIKNSQNNFSRQGNLKLLPKIEETDVVSIQYK